jgi:hypothetical protein
MIEVISIDKTMEQRVNEALDKQHFSLFEIEKFSKYPLMAIKAGIVIGYGLCMEDVRKLSGGEIREL